MMTASPEPPRNKAHDVFCAIVFIVVFVLLVCNLVCSCAASKPAVVVRDSVRVEIRERIVRDTAYFPLQPSEQSVVTKDTTSHLQNAYAETDAAIRGGLLFHSLVTYPKTIEVPVTTVVHDTITVQSSTNTVYVDVPRQSTKWESFLEVCGWILIGIVSLLAMGLIVKVALKFAI